MENAADLIAMAMDAGPEVGPGHERRNTLLAAALTVLKSAGDEIQVGVIQETVEPQDRRLGRPGHSRYVWPL